MAEKLNRVETGVVQFEDDWPGVFIRGDNAMNFAGALTNLLEVVEATSIKVGRGTIAHRTVESLLNLLESSHVGNNPTIQKIERKS